MNRGRCIGFGVYLVDDEMPFCVIAFVTKQCFRTDLMRARRLGYRASTESGVSQHGHEGDNTEQSSDKRTPAGLPTDTSRAAVIGRQVLMIIVLSRVRHNVQSNLTEVTWIPRWDTLQGSGMSACPYAA